MHSARRQAFELMGAFFQYNASLYEETTREGHTCQMSNGIYACGLWLLYIDPLYVRVVIYERAWRLANQDRK
jgi:hypothetical protein